MYEGAIGERFTLYCSKATAPATARCASSEGKSFAAFYWVDDKVGYVVSGPADRDRLEKVTKAIYEQIDERREEVVTRSQSGTGEARRPEPERVHVVLDSGFAPLGASGMHIPYRRADRRACSSRQFFISSSSSSSEPSGSTMRTVASRSPAPSLAFRPLPLRRKVRPELVPAGIASSTAPSSVGTRTLPPSTAS